MKHNRVFFHCVDVMLIFTSYRDEKRNHKKDIGHRLSAILKHFGNLLWESNFSRAFSASLMKEKQCLLSKWDCQSGKISAGAWSLPAPKTEFTETFKYFALLNKKLVTKM